MRWSKTLIPTMKEVPSDAEIPSHQLMLRAGLIRQLMAGSYTYLPLGWKALRKAEAIVRDEMERAGAIEIHMPALQPAELFERTGRRAAFGNVLFQWEQRRGNSRVQFALGPTHEEVVTDLVSKHISSYRQLPLNLFQIQTKFRNEERPRFGVLRTSEFLMKDAYSFHTSLESLSETYQAMYRAYCRVFARCGLEYLPVEAESGPIGGDASHEFMVPANNGEDKIVYCRKSGYAANTERADTGRTQPPIVTSPDAKPLTKLHTPNVGSIDAVCKFLKCKPEKMVKTLIFFADEKPVAVLIRGDHDANEGKIRRALGVTNLEMASPEVILEVTGAPVGFAGPVGIKCPIIADHDVPLIVNAITGANEGDHHVVNVNVGRDYVLEKTFDLRNATGGDPSPRGDGTLELVHGIEVGHVFKLGTKYAVALEAHFSDEKEHRQPIIMGCYGIGVTRILAAVTETRHDENGLIWPLSLAPYEVVVIPLQEEAPVVEAAESIYSQLQQAGVDVLLDDRAQRAGVKFKDADLIGFPLRIVIGGKGLQEGSIELKWRTDAAPTKVPVADAVSTALKQLAERRTQEAANVPA